MNSISLEWTEPFDDNGIDRYRVILDANIERGWQNVFDREIPADATELNITKEFFGYCGYWLRWRVQARDRAGAWGAWSEEAFFLGEEPPVLLFVPLINIPPPPPEIVSPKHASTVSCQVGRVFVDWLMPEDPNGIVGYEVEIYEGIENLIESPSFDHPITEYEITNVVNVYCGHWLSWRVRAKDGFDAWGAWSSQPIFWTQDLP